MENIRQSGDKCTDGDCSVEGNVSQLCTGSGFYIVVVDFITQIHNKYQYDKLTYLNIETQITHLSNIFNIFIV